MIWSAALAALVALVIGVFVFWQQALRPWIEGTPPTRIAGVTAVVWLASGALFYLGLRITLQRARVKLLAATQSQFDALLAQTVGLASVTLGWAIRAELIRDDTQDVQEYTRQLAKREGVKRAIVARTDGIVIASSVPKEHGRGLNDLIEEPPVESSVVQTISRPDGTMRLVVPIMGLESRLGTLLVEYVRPILRME